MEDCVAELDVSEAGAVALDEGSGTEVLQAGARGGQGLAAAAGAGRRVLWVWVGFKCLIKTYTCY